MSRKPPPKSRLASAAYRAKDTRRKPDDAPSNAPDTRGYSAPGHMGGQFEESGYHAGRGMFGFTQDT